MVSWTRSTQPLLWGRPARMKTWRAWSFARACSNSWERNSWALSVVTVSSFQPRRARSSATTSARWLVQWASGVLGRLVELGPGVGAGDVNGGVLPRGSLGAAEAADTEALHLHHLAGVVGVNMAGLRSGTVLRLRGSGVAGHQAQALGSGLQAVPPQHSPDSVGGQLEAAPLEPPQLTGDPQRAAAGEGQGKGQHPLLEHRAGGIGHPRLATFPRPQDLK